MEDFEFDENDLINDYIQNNDEYDEPDDYDFEEEERAHAAYNSGTAVASKIAAPTAAPTDSAMEVEPTEKLDVPLTITTDAPSIASNNLYNFERYSGLSGWRTSKSSLSTKYGATTMEATSWKKEQPKGDADESEDEDDLDNVKERSAPEPIAVNMGAEAHLVRMCQKSEEEMLGRSWGGRTRGVVDGRFIYKSSDRSMPKMGEDSVLVTIGNGTTVNIKLTRKDYSAPKESNGEEILLGLAMGELVRRADVLQRRAIQRKLEREEMRGKRSKVDNVEAVMRDDAEEADEAAKDANEKRDQDETMDDVVAEDKLKADIKKSNKDKHHRREMQLKQRLWVDKHAPTSISHLLSDERTNREVIRALKLWDPYVFKRDAPVRPVPAYGYKQQQAQQPRAEKKPEKKGHDDDGEGRKQIKADVRPDESSRVILLSGPPGVGKSTLAHIVCSHAGYRPIEVNASDERSASALTERVTRAMESSTLVIGDEESGGKSGKPNCIILDEVDGADAKSAISAIVDIVRAEIPPPTKSGKKGGRRTTYLRRPIILICNHKHAPALRPILPYARQFDVQPPNSERLTSRLRAILAAENMSVVAGGMLLHRLVASTGGDVRSCLYALQFASARARELAMKKREREGIVAGSNVVVDISSTLLSALGDTGNGMKDMQSDISNTVATVFRKTKKAKKLASAKVSPDSKQKGVTLVLKAVDHFGDHSKTLDCLFMNVNRVGYIDPTLERCAAAFDWLSGADMYRSQKSSIAMNNNAEHHSMQKYYMPSAAAAIHLLCCIETRPDLTFSTRELSDLHYQSQANVALVQRFVEGMAPKARSGIGGGTDVVVSDLVPYGLWLLSAGDGKYSLSKPVSSVDILSSEEKVAFSSHVATLRALGLTYVKEDRAFNDFKNNVPAENVRLEPDIDKLVRFEHADGGFAVRRKRVPPVLRELLAHGATVAALREREVEAKAGREANNHDENATQSQKQIASTKPILPEPTKAKAEKRVARNFLNIGAAKAKEAKSARRAARVGFDRSKKVKLSNTGSGVELSKVIRFKFQKGFTQAVRAPCQMEDLM